MTPLEVKIFKKKTKKRTRNNKRLYYNSGDNSCQEEKLSIAAYRDSKELLDQRSEILNDYCYGSK